ncbi:MAG: M20/M25/M40 family metallo-hydrolase [Candidatus Hydrogenedentota bacterium]|nr:MAG: M20/M25/M40 family metallo-hydrolase [Candidatus Hydrogenedentota bacterium]
MSTFTCPEPKLLSKKELNEALKHFKAILKMDSRNPDSNEKKVIEYIASIFKKEKIPYKIVQKEKGRLNIVARLKSKSQNQGLLLSSHVDTVPWDESKWKHHPLSAKEDDGYIYGRGAIDMKNHTIYSLMAFLLLKRKKIKLNRDVVFAAFADEEAGCEYGSQFVVEKHPKLLEGVGYALNEVGGFPVYVEDKQFFFIQTEEKGFAWYKITFPGKESHGSLATKDNANYHLSDFLFDLKNLSSPANPSKVTREMIYSMSEELPAIKKFIFRLLATSWGNSLAINVLPAEKREAFYAMTHDTFAPTVIESSKKINVVPGEAAVYVDCRFLPDTSVEEATETLKAILPENATLQLIRHGGPVTDVGRGPFYDLITEELTKDVPDAQCVPYTLVGFSDANQLYKLGIQVLGFSPVFFPPEVNFSDLFHGHNERIHKKGFLWGTDLFYRVVQSFCTETN